MCGFHSQQKGQVVLSEDLFFGLTGSNSLLKESETTGKIKIIHCQKTTFSHIILPIIVSLIIENGKFKYNQRPSIK